MKTKFKFIPGLVIIMTVLIFQSCGGSLNEPVNPETVANKISTPRMKSGSETGGGSAGTSATTYIGNDVKLVRYTYSKYKSGNITWTKTYADQNYKYGQVACTVTSQYTVWIPALEDTYYVISNGIWNQAYKTAYVDASRSISTTGPISASFVNTNVDKSPKVTITSSFSVTTCDKQARVKCVATGAATFDCHNNSDPLYLIYSITAPADFTLGI